MEKWECEVCGYIYDPKKEDKVPFQELPADWVCPQCGVGKEQFSRMD